MKYNFEIIQENVSKGKNGHFYSLILCKCGNPKLVRKDHLNSGAIISCGCYHKEIQKIATLTHGHNRNRTIGKTPTYNTWQNMKKRCFNPKTIQWKDYGGAGITVCKRWLQFKNFLEDMGERPSKEYSIDRINPFGNYCKENCRWATRVEQANNTKGHYAIQILKLKTGTLTSN